MNGSPRDGQWVQFRSDAPECRDAHRTPEGFVVGIYREGSYAVPAVITPPGKQPPAEPPAPVWVPPHVAVLARQRSRTGGDNLVILVDGEAVDVRLDPAKIDGLAPLIEAAHMPEWRRPPGLARGAKLRP